jgi:hypothetical protein
MMLILMDDMRLCDSATGRMTRPASTPLRRRAAAEAMRGCKVCGVEEGGLYSSTLLADLDLAYLRPVEH